MSKGNMLLKLRKYLNKFTQDFKGKKLKRKKMNTVIN